MRDPQKPDPALFEAFRRVLVARSLVHGGFYTDEAVTSVVEACAERVLSHGPAIAARPIFAWWWLASAVSPRLLSYDDRFPPFLRPC